MDPTPQPLSGGGRPAAGSKSWDQRAFVATGALLSGLALPVTGLLDHAAGGSVSAHAVGWSIAHAALGIMFVAFCTWHIVLNRRALLRHLRAARASHGRRVSLPSREVGAAAVLVGGALTLVVAHALAGV